MQVAKNGFNLEVNSATIVEDVIRTRVGPAGASDAPQPMTVTRTVRPAETAILTVNIGGPPIESVNHEYVLSRDAEGNVTYRVDGVEVSAEVARTQYGAVFSEMEANARIGVDVGTARDDNARVEVVESAPRDVDSSRSQGTTAMVVAVRQLGDAFSGDNIVQVSSRLVANRLQQQYLERGREFVPQEEFEETFTEARDEQIKEIRVAGQIGGVFGSVLGKALAGDDKLAEVILGGVLGSLTTSVGQAIATGLAADSLAQGYRTGVTELPTNLARAGVGAISSFITAELIKAIGLDGVAGELANTAAGAVIGQVLSNLSGLNGAEAFRDLLTGVDFTLVFNAVGSYLGTKLAGEIIEFDTIGGQLGSAIGSAIGSIGAVALVTGGGALAAQLGFLGAFAGPVGAFVGAFLGFIAGGLIGSLFGGTPRSGADTQWSEEENRFIVTNVWSRKGGSKDAARSVATAVADGFNGLIATTGGVLLNPEAVQSGNYGMRKKAFVYRPVSSQDKDAITRSFEGKDAAQRLISYGISQGLADPDFQLAGGDVYLKRALYNSQARTSTADGTVDLEGLVGDLTIARDWSFYRNNPGAIEAISSALEGGEREAYLAGWVATAARADDLGLDRRHAADWYGGFEFLLREAGTTAGNVAFYLDYEFASDKYARAMQLGYFALTDSIDVAQQTFIETAAGDDVIDLRQHFIADQRGLMVNSKYNDDIAATGEDFEGLLNAAVSVAPGTNRATVSLTVAANEAGEQDENFGFGLADADGLAIVGSDAEVTIVDAADLPYLQVGRSFVTEADGYAVFRISLSRAAAADVTLALSIDGKGASIDSDFSGALEVSAQPNGGWQQATSLTIAAGVTEYFVRVPVVADNGIDPEGEPTGVEASEQFTLGARVTAGAGALSYGDVLVTGIGTIFDGVSTDPLVWVDDAIVHAGGPANLTIGLSRGMASAGQVTVSTSDRRALHITVAATADGGEGNDTIHASNLGDNLFGAGGNDTLYGGRLDDWLFGGEGNDTLDAGAATANALGGDGNYLAGEGGDDTLHGREGSDWLDGGDGVDSLEGRGGGDILTGGAGDGDTLHGGAGDDHYLFRQGDGEDFAEDVAMTGTGAAPSGAGDPLRNRLAGFRDGTLARTIADWLGTGAFSPEDSSTPAPPAGGGSTPALVNGGEDRLTLGVGIGLGDVVLVRGGAIAGTTSNDLVIELLSYDEQGVSSWSGDRLVMKDWYNSYKKIEWLEFADGSAIRIADFQTFIAGTNANDVIIGTEGRDFAVGGNGDDWLSLLAGDDVGVGRLRPRLGLGRRRRRPADRRQ